MKEEKDPTEEVKLVHFTILDATNSEIQRFAEELNKLKPKLTTKFEFIVTNERVELLSLKHLLNEFYKLYKKTKEDKK